MCIGDNLSPKGAESGPDGVREHDHNVYEDKRCRITMNFDILGDPRPKSLPALVKSAKEDIDKTKNACTRLGFCVRCLEGMLPFGELVKEVRWFDQVVTNIFNVP